MSQIIIRMQAIYYYLVDLRVFQNKKYISTTLILIQQLKIHYQQLLFFVKFSLRVYDPNQISNQRDYMKQISEGPLVIDCYFNECLKKLSKEHRSNVCFYVTRALIVSFVLLLNIYVLPLQEKASQEAFTLFLQLLLLHNIVEVSRLAYFTFSILKSPKKIIKLANSFQHCIFSEEMNNLQTHSINEEMIHLEEENQWGLRVSSTTYDFVNREKISDVSDQHREIRQNIGWNALKGQLQSPMFCYRWLGHIFQGFAVGMFIYSFFLVSQLTLPGFQDNFLQLFILFEIAFKPKVFLVLVLICLIPLILLVVSIYICCCKKEQKVNFPKYEFVTKDSLIKCSECAICFQTFVQGEKIIPLDCSQMHIFHETCIGGWARIKPTCPICRTQI